MEKIIVTKDEYPSLLVNKVTIMNPKKFEENIDLYHKKLIEEYFKGSFNNEIDE